MNPENQPLPTDLESKLSSILDWVEQTAKSAEQFAIEQTPLYIQELLAWNFWLSLIWFFIGCGYCIIAAVSWYKLYRHREEIIDAADFPLQLLWLAPALLFGMCGMLTTINHLNWLQISVAPRVWLVEYVASKL
jgi:ABC-type phosphate transport system permease subunit